MVKQLSQTVILCSLRQSLEPKKHILAMWEGGAAAFGRVGRWSDIDLMVAAKDGQAVRQPPQLAGHDPHFLQSGPGR